VSLKAGPTSDPVIAIPPPPCRRTSPTSGSLPNSIEEPCLPKGVKVLSLPDRVSSLLLTNRFMLRQTLSTVLTPPHSFIPKKHTSPSLDSTLAVSVCCELSFWLHSIIVQVFRLLQVVETFCFRNVFPTNRSISGPHGGATFTPMASSTSTQTFDFRGIE